MKPALLAILGCPQCGGELGATGADVHDGEIVEGTLRCVQGGHEYAIHGGVARFVPADNYAKTFGFQWSRFARTQLDSHSGVPISRDRFLRSTGWSADDLCGARVLDVGCGAGRFTEVALSFGAEVVAVDYSSAVDVCYANNRDRGQLHGLQADIYHLPFKPGAFDYVYCLGVLQHTPDVFAALLALLPPLRSGGQLAVDIYGDTPFRRVRGKYLLRPLTTRMEPARLFHWVERWLVPLVLPVSVAIGRIPHVGRRLRRLLPVSNYDGMLPLTSEQLREWAVLDTFDMLSPRYDQPQTAATLRGWMDEAPLEDVVVFMDGHLIGRGRKLERRS